jgi:streptogramin lyase
MSCALTSGYALGCRNNVGGISEIRLASWNVTGSVNIGSDSVVSSISGYASGFYKYELPKGAGQFTETVNASTENGTVFFQQELTLIVNRLQNAVRNELKLVANAARLLAIVTDRNGNYWLLGESNGITCTGGTAQSGTAMGDRGGYELTFTGMEAQPIRSVSSGIIAGLTSSATITG